jgi:hypothetical protein
MNCQHTPRTASYVVGTPRASDALGSALRDAALPEDLAQLMRQLNGHGGMRSAN